MTTRTAIKRRPSQAIESALASDPKGRFLDAAERLLVSIGHEAITTRQLGKEAGLNHGLVHYYFDSMEELFLAVLERFTARLIVRQRAMYAAEGPFIDKWRKAMGFLDEDFAAGYPQVWFELQAMAWHRPLMRQRLEAVHGEWRSVLTDAFTQALRHYGLDADAPSVSGWVALVTTFNMGLFLERLVDVNHGHVTLLKMIDRWLTSLERKAR